LVIFDYRTGTGSTGCLSPILCALENLELPDPALPTGRDLLVRIHAVSVNPRDVKSRMSVAASADKPVVLGYDASGVVEAVGPALSLARVAHRDPVREHLGCARQEGEAA
jgi:NADPH:quinone reductase-like Zn-dependent oxidoreductase